MDTWSNGLSHFRPKTFGLLERRRELKLLLVRLISLCDIVWNYCGRRVKNPSAVSKGDFEFWAPEPEYSVLVSRCRTSQQGRWAFQGYCRSRAVPSSHPNQIQVCVVVRNRVVNFIRNHHIGFQRCSVRAGFWKHHHVGKRNSCWRFISPNKRRKLERKE